MNDGLLIEDVAEIDVGKLLTAEERWEAHLIIWLRDHPTAPLEVTRSKILPIGEGVRDDGSAFYKMYGYPYDSVCGVLGYFKPSDPLYKYYTEEYCRRTPKTIYWQETIQISVPESIRNAVWSAAIVDWVKENAGEGLQEAISKYPYLRSLITTYYQPVLFKKEDERRLLALQWMLRYEGFLEVADLLAELMPMIEKYLRPLPPIPKSELHWQQDWLESAKKYAAWYRHNIVQAEIRTGIDGLISICNSFSVSDLMEMKYNTQQAEKYIG